jgi:hypothetical protein
MRVVVQIGETPSPELEDWDRRVRRAKVRVRRRHSVDEVAHHSSVMSDVKPVGLALPPLHVVKLSPSRTVESASRTHCLSVGSSEEPGSTEANGAEAAHRKLGSSTRQ